MGPEELNLHPNSSPPENAGPTVVKAAADTTSEPEESPVAVWIHRITLVVYVMFCIEIGLVLAVLPWRPVWTDNSIVIAYPMLRAFLGNNFVRGVVTGVGLLDLWIGIWDAVHYREHKKQFIGIATPPSKF
jgi:hypothetical protein